MKTITIKQAIESGYKFVKHGRNRLLINENLVEVMDNHLQEHKLITPDGKFEVYDYLQYPICNPTHVAAMINHTSNIKVTERQAFKAIVTMKNPANSLHEKGSESFAGLVFLQIMSM
jgi:hypothetical protein